VSRAANAWAAGLLAAVGCSALLAAQPMAQRAKACTGCHGEQGRAAADGYYPRLAGKPAAYLHEQLRAFRDGRRRYALMTELIEPLSDAYLRELAEYFAALEVPYPPPQAPTATASALERGRALALQGDAGRGLPPCTDCHGPALAGTSPGIPALLGLPRDYVNAQLGAWREGSRRSRAPDCMAEIARRLAPEDIGALSQWLAAQPVLSGRRARAQPDQPLPLRCGGDLPPRAR